MAQPVPPIYQPEVPARAILFGATHRRREIWVGWPTVQAIWANRIAPGFADHYLAKFGYTSQTTDQKLPPNYKGNLLGDGEGHYGAHGRFDSKSRTGSWRCSPTAIATRYTAASRCWAELPSLHQLAKKYNF